MKEFIAILDIGGSGIKISARSLDNESFLSESIKFAPDKVGRNVHGNPEKLWKTITESLSRISSRLKTGEIFSKLYVSSLRQGFTIIRESKEIYPLVYNSDTTGIYAEPKLDRLDHDELYRKSGHWFAPQLTLPKLVHIQNQNPEVMQGNVKLSFFHDWAIWRLTGTLLTEPTLLAAGQLWDLQRNSVNHGLMSELNLPLELIPAVIKTGTSVGAIRREVVEEIGRTWADCVVQVGGGDSHFFHIGAAGLESGKAVVSAGSSTPISIISSSLGTYHDCEPWISPSLVSTDYFIEGNLGYPGSFYDWLTSHSRNTFESDIGISDPSNWPITDIPVVLGSSRSWSQKEWRERPAFSVVNMDESMTTSDLIKGLLIDYALSIKSQLMQLTDDSLQSIVITGGGASSELTSLLATVMGRPIIKSSSADASLSAISHLEKLFGSHPMAETFEPLEGPIAAALAEREDIHQSHYLEAMTTQSFLEARND
jgi:sugar (pentulose or hexulose) kinase